MVTFALTTLRFGLMTREDAGSGLAIAASTVPRSALASRLRPLFEALRIMWRSVMRTVALRGAR